MKTLKILFSVLVLSIFVSSCSSDDDNSTKVKYQIVGIDNAVTAIQYKKSNGSMETLTDYTDFAGSGDAKTISVSNYPFTADLKVTVNNTTNAVKTYSLAIYVDGEVQDLTPFSIAPMSIATGEVDVIIANE